MKCIYNNREQLCVTKRNHLEIQSVKDWTFNYYNHSKQELIETEASLLSRILLMNLKYVTY